MRNQEARYAVSYFVEFGKVCKVLGYDFKRRNISGNNMHAPDLPNGLLNYSYAILQTYVKRAINSIGLDSSIPFLHDLRRNTGLVYDLMELWRTNSDYSVLQTLDQLKRTKRTHFLTDGYEVMLQQETVRSLIEKIRLNLSLEEILFNCRILAKFMLGNNKTLSFSLKPLQVKPLFENDQVKHAILSKSFRELGMNKSTLWYQKKRLSERGSIRIYNKTAFRLASVNSSVKEAGISPC
jgi:CRISPR-associated protein Cas1